MIGYIERISLNRLLIRESLTLAVLMITKFVSVRPVLQTKYPIPG